MKDKTRTIELIRFNKEDRKEEDEEGERFRRLFRSNIDHIEDDAT